MTRPGVALFLGASAMFANMYSTQAILPDIESGLGVSAAAAGLTITVVVLAVALGGWVAGPLSDRLGRRPGDGRGRGRLICIPTAVAGLAPNLPALLAIRACQGFLMPGLLTVAVPYVTERFRGPAAGAAMGAYTASLVFGGLVGRVGTAIVADLASWRVALEALAIPTVAGAFAMYFWLPRDQPATSTATCGRSSPSTSGTSR